MPLTPAAIEQEARIRRLERQGGRLLGRDPLDPDVQAARTGIAETGRRFFFECPMCGKRVVNDQEMEPVCTGPNWTDDHPLELMTRIEP